MFKKLSQVQKDLQTLATQHGKSGYEAAKAAYLKRYTVVSDDADETVLSPADVEETLDIKFSDESESELKSGDDSPSLKMSDISAIIAKTVKDAVAASNVERKGFAEQHRKSSEVVVVNGYRPRNFKSAEACYDAGQWLLATLGRSQKAAQKCADRGIAIRPVSKSGEPIEKGHIEGNNTIGGWLVPSQIDADMINLTEQFGVFRRNARMTVMTSDELHRRRRKGGMTVAFKGEAQAGSESTMQWDKVSLYAKTTQALTTFSAELNEDAAMNVADLFVEECALAQSTLEDTCGFLGAGTGAHGGISGLQTKALSLSGTIANIQCLNVQSGTGSFSGLVIGDFYATQARVQTMARNSGRCKWYMNPSFLDRWANPLVNAQINDRTQIVNGRPVSMFLGYPVEFCEILPHQWVASQVYAWFGDLSLAAMFGDRRGNSVAFSDSALGAFENNEIAARMDCRFGITVHDLGTASATASARVKGPMAGLISAAS